ncbi:MAG TPA: sodium:calcium symporter [Verrucomicrobiae bacterium]
MVFAAASLLLIWRLEAMTARGVEGTVLGTLVMPYCSGIGNLTFVFILARQGGPGAEVMTNALVNNVTNLTLLIGLPAIFWGMGVSPATPAAKRGKKSRPAKTTSVHELHRLSLLLTLVAVLFFTGAVWALAHRNGQLGFTDGLILVGLFLFWQCFHVFEVLKSNARQGRTLGMMLWVDLALLGLGAWATYVSIDWLVGWVLAIKSGFISAQHLGWLSGWLMVLPNALLALYYGWRGNPEVVYTSQVGDGHICIPLCVGIYALWRPLAVSVFFHTGILLLVLVTLVHLFFVATLGRLPRWMGWVLVAGYLVFLAMGLPQ